MVVEAAAAAAAAATETAALIELGLLVLPPLLFEIAFVVDPLFKLDLRKAASELILVLLFVVFTLGVEKLKSST